MLDVAWPAEADGDKTKETAEAAQAGGEGAQDKTQTEAAPAPADATPAPTETIATAAEPDPAATASEPTNRASETTAITKPIARPFSLAVTPNETEYTLHFTLPTTIPKDSIELSVSPENTALTFKFEEKKEGAYRRVERVWGLPRDADAERVEACWKEGGVEVKVGRKEVPKKKLISVL
jgi:HSP20 family molecular chaperone IbpA